ncbi:MAG: hypothetical protein ACXABO_10095 [Promethearchaeota archaeon]
MDDCFDKILKASSNSDVTKYKVIIKLMKDLEDGISDALRFRNCLLFLINICFKVEYGDYTDRIGKPPQELTQEEKISFQDLLRCEFNN